MLRQGLILTSNREYAQAMRQGLLGLGKEPARVDVELDALRAMQLVPQLYDLILIDILLDAMDGLQLLLLMKQQAPGTKFIIVSDVADETSRAQAYQNGADFFLERPRTPEALTIALEAIRGLLKPNRESKRLQSDKADPLVGIADIVQTRCLSGDSVLLLVQSRQQSGDIFIFQGEVFHAQYPGRSGKGAFQDMIQWDGGKARIKALKLTHVPVRTIETPYLELLKTAESSGAMNPDMRPMTGQLRMVAGEASFETTVPEVVLEAPPLEEAAPTSVSESLQTPNLTTGQETELPAVNAHWKISLTGELMEGSQVAEPDRCAFITYFIYRKMADIAVALEVDYFTHLTLLGPHLQQMLVADNMGVRHAVFDAAWTNEDLRVQYAKWCCEQSL